MWRVWTKFALIALAATTCIVSPALGQRVDREGKTWLSTCSDPAALNVTGVWKDAKWGNITLNQHQDSRQVVGSGDGWNISGIVSGKSVCLLFFNGDKVTYSAKLTEDASGNLAGGYVKGMLSEKSKTSPMRLVKTK
jgi:hypothetical protein